MSRTLGLLPLVLAITLGLQLLVGAPAALAASDTEAQNPELTVSLSVPDEAKLGDTVAATITITNNSRRIEAIAVQGVWLDPSGESTVQNRNGLLLPGQTVTRVIDYLVNETCPPARTRSRSACRAATGHRAPPPPSRSPSPLCPPPRS